MQSQVKLCFPLTPRRPNTLYIRAHSQPAQRIKTTQKIKINLKRLPTDFFTGPHYLQKINNMAKIKIGQQSLNQSYRQSNAEFMSNTLNFSNKHQFRDFKNRQLSSLKKHKTDLGSKQKNVSLQVSSENSNSLNWTFAKNFGGQEVKHPEYRNRAIKMRTQRSRTIQTQTLMKQEQDQPKAGNQKWSEEGLQAIHHLISDKITEINLNRLRINVRKNNHHPPSTLQFIRRQFA